MPNNKKTTALLLKLWKQRNWDRRMVCHSKEGDAKRGRLPADMATYVNPQYLRTLRDTQSNQCPYCTVKMQTENRKAPDGLTLQRLDNRLGHTRANCLLACHQCNVRRVENNKNETYLRDKRNRLYFERLLASGYARQENRAGQIA